MNELAAVWFDEAKKLDYNEAIFIRVANKTEQTRLENDLWKEREDYATVDPVLANQIFIYKTIKDERQYVVLERKYRAVFTAFRRDAEGNYSRITADPERRRILELMVEDKKDRSEIEEVLNGLTELEVMEFFP